MVTLNSFRTWKARALNYEYAMFERREIYFEKGVCQKYFEGQYILTTVITAHTHRPWHILRFAIRVDHMNAFTTHTTHNSRAVSSVSRKCARRRASGCHVISPRAERRDGHGADTVTSLLKKRECPDRIALFRHDDTRGPRYRLLLSPSNFSKTRMIDDVMFGVNLFFYYWCVGAYTILYFSACYYVGTFI